MSLFLSLFLRVLSLVCHQDVAVREAVPGDGTDLGDGGYLVSERQVRRLVSNQR